jgi:hypothetical protein
MIKSAITEQQTRHGKLSTSHRMKCSQYLQNLQSFQIIEQSQIAVF